jgi:membrane protease subunit HflC
MKKDKNININAESKANVKEAKKLAKAEKKAIKSENKKDSGVAFLILKIVIALVLVVVIAYFGFACVVREGNAAIILRFGAPRQTVTEAGLYFKLPWPFETVVTYDNREQYLESNNLETTTMDKKNIILKSYAIWQIDDPLSYHNSVGSNGTVDSYIKNQIFSATNSIMGMYNLSDLISSSNENLKTQEIQNKIFELVKENCEVNYGIKILDVSILRVSYPETNLQSIFANISAERQGVIDAILADANAKASNITSSADAEASKIIAEGENKAAEIRAKTEKDVAEIYAKAQAANIELFKFLKELDTIVNSVNSNSVLIVDSKSYPFNILLEYGKTVDESTAVVEDLEYLLANLPEKDREALVTAIEDLLDASAKAEASDNSQSGAEG